MRTRTINKIHNLRNNKEIVKKLGTNSIIYTLHEFGTIVNNRNIIKKIKKKRNYLESYLHVN